MMAGVLFNNMAAIIMSTEKSWLFQLLVEGTFSTVMSSRATPKAFSFAMTCLLGVV